MGPSSATDPVPREAYVAAQPWQGSPETSKPQSLQQNEATESTTIPRIGVVRNPVPKGATIDSNPVFLVLFRIYPSPASRSPAKKESKEPNYEVLMYGLLSRSRKYAVLGPYALDLGTWTLWE